MFGGNPLAVFPEAPPLDDAMMQRIAAELNLSETVFVYPPESRWLCAVIAPASELLVTAYPTDAVKSGELLWTPSA